MNFRDIQFIEAPAKRKQIALPGDLRAEIRAHIPIREKGDLISWALNMSLDDRTGCFSPFRTEVCFSIAVVKWYSDIEVDDEDIERAYEAFDRTNIFAQIVDFMEEGEFDLLQQMMNDTINDVARYNNSLVGMLQLMSGDADNLGNQVDTILAQIKNKEGLEELAAIKDVVGSD